jgi:hypothetical protein
MTYVFLRWKNLRPLAGVENDHCYYASTFRSPRERKIEIVGGVARFSTNAPCVPKLRPEQLDRLEL